MSETRERCPWCDSAWDPAQETDLSHKCSFCGRRWPKAQPPAPTAGAGEAERKARELAEYLLTIGHNRGPGLDDVLYLDAGRAINGLLAALAASREEGAGLQRTIARMEREYEAKQRLWERQMEAYIDTRRAAERERDEARQQLAAAREEAGEAKQEACRWTEMAARAWVLLATVNDGDWTQQSREWQTAMAHWRDNYNSDAARGAAQGEGRGCNCHEPLSAVRAPCPVHTPREARPFA